MTAMERLIVEHVTGLGNESALKSVLLPIFPKLFNLDFAGWQTQFNADGFTDGDIDKLDAIVEEWISSINLERLPALVSNIQDMGDESELEQAYNRCLGQVPLDQVSRQIWSAGFPNPTDAFCYAVGRLGHVIDSIFAFESMSRELRDQPDIDWSMTPEQVAEGVALAEVGLAEDATSWANY